MEKIYRGLRRQASESIGSSAYRIRDKGSSTCSVSPKSLLWPGPWLRPETRTGVNRVLSIPLRRLSVTRSEPPKPKPGARKKMLSKVLATRHGQVGAGRFSSNAMVDKAPARHSARFEKISAVYNDGIVHQIFHFRETGPSKFIPFGKDDKSIGPFQAIIGVGEEFDGVAEVTTSLRCGFWVVSLDSGSLLE